MNKILPMIFCILFAGPSIAADDYKIRLAFPSRTIEGAKCSNVEYRIRPQFGITVAECANVSQTCPTIVDPVHSLGYENAVRLNAANIYTECQFIEADESTQLITLLFACVETMDPGHDDMCLPQSE